MTSADIGLGAEARRTTPDLRDFIKLEDSLSKILFIKIQISNSSIIKFKKLEFLKLLFNGYKKFYRLVILALVLF